LYPQKPDILCWEYISFKESWGIFKGLMVLEIKVDWFLISKPKGKGPFGKPRYRGEVNINVDVNEMR
jgi:hypothetical protein